MAAILEKLLTVHSTAGAAYGGRPEVPPLAGTGAHAVRPAEQAGGGPCGGAERRHLGSIHTRTIRQRRCV